MKHIIKIIAAVMAATIMSVTAHAEAAEKERFDIWRNQYINMAKIVELVKMTYDSETCSTVEHDNGAMEYYSEDFYISETECYYAWRDVSSDGRNISWGVLYRNTDEHADVFMSCKYCGLFDENLRNARNTMILW